MGFFIYDSSREVAVDDRTLVHLQVVIIDKFRRNERFAMTLFDQKRFVTEATSTYRWSITLDEGQVRRLFTTFSDWSADEVDAAAHAVRDLGGHVEEHYQSWLIVLRPVRRAVA